MWLHYSKTGGLHFGKATSKNLSEVVSGFQHIGVKYEELSSAEANERFEFFKLPVDYKCVIEEDAGILAANKAVDAFQVINWLYSVFCPHACVCVCAPMDVFMSVWVHMC